MRHIKWLILVGLLGLTTPASALTIYFAGGEDISWASLSGVAYSPTAAPYNTNFARGALGPENGTTVADPPANKMISPPFTANSSLWVHAVFWADTNVNTSGQQALILYSPDGVARILLRQTGTAGTLKASTRNAAGTITDLVTATGTYAGATQTTMDLAVVYGCTSGDTLKLYFSAALVLTYTGNLCTDSATQLNKLALATLNNSTGSGTYGCHNGFTAPLATCWSEVIVSDSDTRSMHLWTLAPVAAGNTQSWTPNTVGNVNPVNANDANFVSTTSTSALSQWTTPTTAPTGTWSLLAVVQEARARASTVGPQHFEWNCRSGATDNVTGSLAPNLVAFGNFSNQIWANNCKTGSPWAIGDIATGFNLGVQSLP